MKLAWEIVALFMVIAAISVPIMLPGMGSVLADKGKDKDNTVVIQAYTTEAGGFKPNVIWVKKGQPLRIEVESMDVTHGLVIDGLGVDTGIVDPGEKKTVEFVPEEVGIYSFRCPVLCSPYHWFMRGTIVVTP